MEAKHIFRKDIYHIHEHMLFLGFIFYFASDVSYLPALSRC